LRAQRNRRDAFVFRDREIAMRLKILLSIVIMSMASGYARADENASAPDTSSEPKTLKERLGDKASDDQRVDNCKVPVGQRGSKPRPDTCPQSPQ
jgi:hypothetical protein